MADAYAQITGRPAIVNLHTAPGMGNAQGALYNAYINKTPLIVTAGNQRRDMQNQMCLLTNVDATMVPKPFVKWSAEPAIASEVPAVLARAIHIANTAPRGPVFVSLPMDDMAVELTESQSSDIDVVRTRTVTHAGGFPDRRSRRYRRTPRQREIARADRRWRRRTIRRVGRGDRTRRTHPVCRAHRTADRAVRVPRESPALPGTLPPGAGWISKALTGRDLVRRHRRTGFPVLPQDRRARICRKAPA